MNKHFKDISLVVTLVISISSAAYWGGVLNSKVDVLNTEVYNLRLTVQKIDDRIDSHSIKLAEKGK